jgi:hypothetical protein
MQREETSSRDAGRAKRGSRLEVEGGEEVGEGGAEEERDEDGRRQSPEKDPPPDKWAPWGVGGQFGSSRSSSGLTLACRLVGCKGGGGSGAGEREGRVMACTCSEANAR